MKKNHRNNTLALKGAIAPQYFYIGEEGLCYFDRINAEEGRFWRINGGKQRVILETEMGQGMLDDYGDMYILDTGEDTVLTPVRDGRLQMPIELKGMFYDFKVSSDGSMLFLGNRNGDTIVVVKNNMGGDTAELKVKELVFASCLAIDKEDIYLGGIEKSGGLSIAVMNYLGQIKQLWKIECSSKERIVSKLQLYGNSIIMLIGGAYDTIGMFSMETGQFKEVRMVSVGMKSCVDIQVFGDELYMLDRKTLASMDIEELEKAASSPVLPFFTRNRDSLSYEYLMYTRSIRTQAGPSVLPSIIWSSLITVLLLLSNQITFGNYVSQGVFQLLLSIIGVYLIASFRNVAALSDKAGRIDNLLSLYNEREGFAASYAFPMLSSSTIFSFVYLMWYPGRSMIHAATVAVLFMAVSSSLQVTCLRKLKMEKDDVIVELLKDDDPQTETAIRETLNRMKTQGCERICINIATEDKNIVRRINKWFITRRCIIGKGEDVISDRNTISIMLDLSQRDIRYSRFSIVMDYITYLRKSMVIENASIHLSSFTKGNELTKN